MALEVKMTSAWISEVESARNNVLGSKRNPTRILVDVFELCQEDFDIRNIKNKQPQLYKMLQEFCSDVPEKDSDLRIKAKDLACYFAKHKDEVRECDVQIYYALLNFMDMLKAKHMYAEMIA